jgi:hypothetical protein
MKIHIFESIEEAVSLLKQYNTKKIEKKEVTKEYIIKNSVSSNIFRAFHKLNKKPSLIYREWTSEHLDEIITNLNKIITAEDYNKHLLIWTYSFIQYWNSQVSNPDDRIIFGPASKMINLLIKTLNQSIYINNNALLSFMNIPLDEYTLKPLMKIINDLTEIKYKIDIPKNPTMKFINTPELYWIIQNALFRLCNKAEISPILYDYWCWNEKH